MKQSPKTENHLLANLTEAELNRLLPQMERFDLVPRRILHETDRTINHVYFPEHGVISLVSSMKDGSVIEVATVGREGMVGLPVFLGADTSPLQAFPQVEGRALRMETSDFKRVLARQNGLHRVLHRYTQALFTQLSQSVACNRLHSLEQRCARWLLATADRVERPVFSLTQDFLAQMLGVRRAGVNATLQLLQKQKMITYKQGRMQITDRDKLERVSCECYRIVRKEYEEMTGVG